MQENVNKLLELLKKYVKIVDSLDDFYTVWKIPDSLEDFQIVWRISGQSQRLPYSVENVLDSLEIFRIV